MKRKPTEFYKQMHELRDKYGQSEYDRDELLPAAMALLGKYEDGNELLREAANAGAVRSLKAGPGRMLQGR